MSKSPASQGFIASLVAEIAAVSADLPPDGPTKDALPEGAVQAGTIADPHTKALHFMIKRCDKELRVIKGDSLQLQAKRVLNTQPYESEAREIVTRGHLCIARRDLLVEMFATAVAVDTGISELPKGTASEIILGPNWEVAYMKQEKKPDPFAEGLLKSLLAGGGSPRFAFVSGSELAELLRG